MTSRLEPLTRSDGLAASGPARPSGLPRLTVLVLMPWSGCALRCRMCDIWRDASGARLAAADVAAEAPAWRQAGLEQVLLSGGEPLLHPELWRITAALRASGIRSSLLAGGPGLALHAEAAAAEIDELVVSLDGPPALHDRIRGQSGAHELLAAGLAALRARAPGLPTLARCTVQRGNHAALRATLRGAIALGIDRLSLLAVDVHSGAFGRAAGSSPARERALLPRPAEIDVLERELALLFELPEARRRIVESPAKLKRELVDRFRAQAAGRWPPPASCNAPRVSAVVEADGRVRPCFFQPPIGRWPADGALLDILASAPARAAVAAIDPERDPICRGCVCRLNLAAPAATGSGPVV